MAPRWLGSFQARLVLAFALLIAGMGTAVCLSVLYVYERQEEAAFELRATSMASVLSVSTTNAVYELRFDQLRILLERVLQQPHVLYAYVYDRDGRVMADGTRENRHFNVVPDDPVHRAVIAATTTTIQYSSLAAAGGERVLDVAQPIVVAGDVRLGGVRLGLTMRPVQEAVARARRYAFGAGLVFMVLGGLLSALIGRRLVSPIGELVQATRLVAAGDLDVRIAHAPRDEIGLLADSFNRMAERLRRHQAALERKVVETRALYEIGREMSARADLETILRLIVERARTLLEADAAVLALRDEGTGALAVRASSGVEAAGARLSAALESRDAEVGRLSVAMHGSREFGDEDRQLLRALADLAATAVETAALDRTVEAHAEALEARIRERTRELEEANRQLEAASRHKSTFLANVSHELRTPLNAIIGFTRLVLRKAGPDLASLQRENLRKVLASGEQLLALINGLLDLSKIEAGRMDVLVERFSIDEVVTEAASTVEPMLRDGRTRLVTQVAAGIPPLMTDRDKVLQILLNLLSNAVKFTDEGQIAVRASAEDDALTLVVADTGVGIEAAALPYIFEEFRQVGTPRNGRRAGTGLGLAIVKRLAALLRGRVQVESEVGRGSTFAVTIPLRWPGNDRDEEGSVL